MYEDLVKQFNDKYTEEEKNLLFLYKSRIGVAINCLNEEEDKVYEIYEYYKENLKDPKNMFMSFTVFKDISLTDFSSFKRSLQQAKENIEPLLSRLELISPMTVYRMVSVQKGANNKFLSKQNIVSTSVDINECLKFCINDDDYEHYLYQINLEKGSKVAICPYAVVTNNLTGQFNLTTKKDQKELILDKKNYEFSCSSERKIILADSTEINFVTVNAHAKETIKDFSR